MAQETSVGDGEVFGPYRLRSLLGRGGMGEVWLAHHSTLDREVALKRIAGMPSQDAELQVRFRREARLAARLRSAHAVPIHEFGEIDGRLYLDMHYVRGPDLRRVLDDHPYGLPPDAACDVAAQVADALDSAHELELVHRDVKPSNVLVDQSRGRWFCYLADFGVAVPAADVDTRITTTGATIGTPAYMAPELLSEDGKPGVASDVYALGCLFYEMLTGRTPFPGANHASVLYQHMHAEPPLPSAHRADLARFDPVVRTALAKDPAQRFRTAGDLARALAPPMETTPPPGTRRPVSQPSFPMPAPGRAPARRSRLPLALGLVLATLLAAGAVYVGVRALGGDDRAAAPAPVPTAVSAELLPLQFDQTLDVVVSRDGRQAFVLAVQGGVATVDVVDTATRQVTRRAGVDAKASYLTVSPDGTRAFVALRGTDDAPGDSVQIVDMVQARVTATTAVGPKPIFPALSPDGSRLWVTVSGEGDGPGSLVGLDATTGAVTSRTQVGPGPAQIALSPDGRTAYVALGGTSNVTGPGVSVVDTTARRVVRTVPTRPYPFGLALSPDGRRLYVGTNSGETVATLDIMDTASFAVVPAPPTPGLSLTGQAVVSPDGSRVLTINQGTDKTPGRSVSVLDANGAGVGSPALLSGRPFGVSVTPDGHHAWVAASDPGGVWLVAFP